MTHGNGLSRSRIRSRMGRRGHMNNRATLVFALATVIVACRSNAASPVTPTSRTTETITTTALLHPDGITVYPTGFPTMVVRQRGQVEATATFTQTADCRFIFSMCSATITSACGTPALELETPRGPGPTLMASGPLAPDNYYLLMSARVGGVSLCSTVPPGGVPFAYSVTVTHP